MAARTSLVTKTFVQRKLLMIHNRKHNNCSSSKFKNLQQKSTLTVPVTARKGARPIQKTALTLNTEV